MVLSMVLLLLLVVLLLMMQGSGNAKKEIPSNKQTQIDPISPRMGLPPPSKFTRGHLPHSQVLPRDDTNSSSEYMSTDLNREVYGRRYSSPQDVPSAPPIPGSYTGIKQEKEQSPSSKLDRVDSHEFLVNSYAEKNTYVVDMKTHQEQETLNSSSSLEASHAFIAYDACVRLCLDADKKGCTEATDFLNKGCALLRNAFGLQHVLLQSEEERSSGVGSEGAAPKQKKMVGKMKVQVRKVEMSPPKLKPGSVRHNFAIVKSKVSSTSRSSSSANEVQESYSCQLRLKSSAKGDTIRMQSGSGEDHIFFPDSLLDELIIEVQDSKGNHYGCVRAEVATISKVQNDKPRWWSIYQEPKHKVGKVQLHINYTTSLDENGLKCGSSTETMAYDLAMEAAMKKQNFQQRNLKLHDPWKWLLTKLASHYGVSEAYTKLRYLSYIMDVATPTNDCLSLVYEELFPVKMKGNPKSTLNHQENGILREIEDQIEGTLAVVFQNYKMLDESSPSGMIDVFRPATGVAAPVLKPAVELYKLLHDIISPEAQNKLYSYLQAAAKKISRRHLTDTEESLNGDDVTVSTAYQKMKSLCHNFRNEILTDIEIHNCDIFPNSIDLPNLSSAIYSPELCSTLRSFLVAYPPARPSCDVRELVIATADFQKDLATWNINPVEGGVDAKELFRRYIIKWIQDDRLSLLEKLHKVKWSEVIMRRSSNPFVDQMYDHLKDTLDDYNVIINRWPEYTFDLENAIVDFDKAVIEALDKQYADVLAHLKEIPASKKFFVKCVQKLTKRTPNPYAVPSKIGILLNSMKRMLDVLRPEIDSQLKSWGSCCIPNDGSTAAGERLSEVTVLLRSKFKNYLKAVVDKLYENTRMQNSTKLKKILQDSKGSLADSEIRNRMQPLTEQITRTLDYLHTIFETQVFIAICQGYWGRIGKDVLSFLENLGEKNLLHKSKVAVSDVFSFPKKGKENELLYKGSRVVISILNDTFSSKMQKLLGHALEKKDLEPPPSIVEVQSMLY